MLKPFFFSKIFWKQNFLLLNFCFENYFALLKACNIFN